MRANGDWRLKALDWMSLAMTISGALWVALFTNSHPSLPWFVGALAVGAVSCVRRIPFSTRLSLLIATLTFVTLLGGLVFGPSAEVLGTGMLAVLLSGVLAGVRFASIAFVATTLAVGSAFWAQVEGWSPYAHDPSLNDPRRVEVAVRITAAYVQLTGMIALGAAFMVQHLTRSLGRLETALAEAKESRVEAERAAEAKDHALTSLVEAQKFEVLAQLSASVAHDFNNSLQIIYANAATIQNADERVSDEEREESAREILEVCRESSQMARQLLTLGQRLVLERRTVDVGEEVLSLQRSISRLLPSNIQIVSQTESGHYAYVDKVQLKQAVLNLAINAGHAMPEGGELRLSVGANREGEVLIEVSDDGVGIDSVTQGRIFDPFFTTKGAKGTGLGLATVRAIVEQHDGRVEVESEPGGGSTFRLLIPSCEEGQRDSSTGELLSLNLGGIRILVVDDDVRVRSAIIGMLTAAGATTYAADNGEEAVALAEMLDEPPHLLCADAVMPGMPTRALIETFAERFPGTRTLVCSAYVESELLRRGIETHIVPHLAKPFSPEQLISKVQRIVRGGREESRWMTAG